ncbi:hypothetical protein PENTCL1PPCAC_26655, partial [Pristionchus entomophagus]
WRRCLTEAQSAEWRQDSVRIGANAGIIFDADCMDLSHRMSTLILFGTFRDRRVSMIRSVIGESVSRLGATVADYSRDLQAYETR